MKPERQAFLNTLREASISDDVPIVSETNGKFLHFLVGLTKAKDILEVGMANGYSTIHLADAVENNNGHVTTIDVSTPSIAWAKKNFKEADVEHLITLHEGLAEDILPTLHGNLYDMIFIDAMKKGYKTYWEHAKQMMKPDTLVVFDDVMKFKWKMEDFHTMMENETEYEWVILPIDDDDATMIVRKK